MKNAIVIIFLIIILVLSGYIYQIKQPHYKLEDEINNPIDYLKIHGIEQASYGIEMIDKICFTITNSSSSTTYSDVNVVLTDYDTNETRYAEFTQISPHESKNFCHVVIKKKNRFDLQVVSANYLYQE